MENKKTAVEWLIFEMVMEYGIVDTELYDKARQIEQEQHNETWDESRVCDMGDDYLGKEKTFEEYYNETYK